MILRTYMGILAKDMPLYVRALWLERDAYLEVRNRHERLQPAPDGSGFRCDWRWTSELHAPRHVPLIGRQLLRRALADHPVTMQSPTRAVAAPEMTFIIGHRGSNRLPLLLATLESIGAQEGVTLECIVVEQDAQSHLATRLPDWVRHVYVPAPNPDMPFCRSWAFNVGAAHARAPVLVLHDNDLLVPRDYAAEVMRRTREGYEVMNLKRFIFYLSESDTNALLHYGVPLTEISPQTIVQNAEGGGSIAITREVFDAIGGMDESFVGWGGEDSEFWERACTRHTWFWGYLPLVHLWHTPQPGKLDVASDTALRYRQLAGVPPQVRIDRLRGRPRALASGPVVEGS